MINGLASRLKELRERTSLTQKQAAKRIGISDKALSSDEGEVRQPHLEILVKLATLYKVSTDYLLGLSKTKSIDMSRLDEDSFTALYTLVEKLSQLNDYDRKSKHW